MKDARVKETLMQAFGDADSDARKSAAEALLKIDNSSAVEFLIQALQDENSGVRRDAAWAPGEAGDEKARGSLMQVMGADEDAEVRLNAAKALKRLGKK